MKKIDLGRAIQILANLGVVAGIVFLGLELARNNELLEYQRRLSNLELNLTQIDLLISYPELRSALLKDLSAEEELSADERLLIIGMLSKVYQTLEWQFLESPANHDKVRRAIIESGESSVEPLVWASLKPGLDPTFVEFAEDAMKERERP